MLDPAVMREALRTFGDHSDVPDFVAFPGDEDAARAKWGMAFFEYVKTISPPVTTTSVALTFRNKLRLQRSFSGMAVTSDFAAAWRAAMLTMGPAWDEPVFTTRETSLRMALALLFESPTNNTFARLDAIANAFHAATNGMTANSGSTVYG